MTCRLWSTGATISTWMKLLHHSFWGIRCRAIVQCGTSLNTCSLLWHRSLMFSGFLKHHTGLLMCFWKFPPHKTSQDISIWPFALSYFTLPNVFLYPSPSLYDPSFASCYLKGKFRIWKKTFVTLQNPAFKIIFTMDFKSIWNLKLRYDFFSSL